MSSSGSNRPPPAPRGILKNRERDQGSRFEGEGHASSMMNPGPGGSWMTGGGLMSGNDSALPTTGSSIRIGKDIDIGLGRSLHEKLSEFIAQKADILFKPLTSDEMPLAEVKGTQQNSEDHYGVVPSLDHFLKVDSSELRRYFFQNVQPGDVLIASIHSKNSSGLILKLLSTDGGKHIVLENLGIKPFCPASQTIMPSDAREANRAYEHGDLVRVEVIEVISDNEKLVCGMKGVTLSPEMQHSFHLGLISKNELPRQFTLSKEVGESKGEYKNKRTYEEILLSSSGFQNPNNISHLASTMGILSTKNSLMTGLRGAFPLKEMASQLRRVQNAKWAHGNVAEGIKFFKMEKFTEAFQCLNKALSIDAENVEGLVARGALYANSGGYEKAIDDFEAALKFNPNHYNARKYLAETLVALGRQQEDTGKFEDAVASYSKCLVVKPDHKEAKEALWVLFEKTNKLDLSKLSTPAAATKVVELKEKLRAILQSELGMKLDGKNSRDSRDKKKKKKGRRNSSGSEDGSSSSSSSESDSDSSSSEDSDRGKKKKKSKKKKSKKSKKNKKSRDESKTRELSLSPFSKRLVDPRGAAGSGLAGFSESTFAEWGQQLGISKPEKKVDSDEESKRSGKKSKDKKRSKKKEKRKKRKRASSSSSSSDSDASRGRDREKKKSRHSAGNATQNTGIEGIIPDLGDLEAKLSAYYSKIEQEKIEPIIPPESVRITVEQNVSHQRPLDAYDTPARKIEVQSKSEDIHERRDPRDRSRDRHERHHQPEPVASAGGWHETNLGKIELRTDDYGNYIQPENIIRTVVNDTSTAEAKPIKFEMKFKAAGSGAPPPPSLKSDSQSNQNESGSKWRPLGSAPPDGDKGDKSPARPDIKNPFEVQRWDGKGKEPDRHYRGRKSSRSPSPGGRRRKRSSRSRSYTSSSYSSRSRSRSRSRSPGRLRRNPRDFHDRRDSRDFMNNRGRAPVRFFRGFNRGGRRPFIQNRGRTRGNGPSRSRFRNRFSRSMSRSRSRSHSKSRRSRSRSRSRSGDRRRDLRDSIDVERRDGFGGGGREPEKVDRSKEMESVIENEEIRIGGLTTTKASDVEELLDKRNAEKKEELRKSNPDFFRN